MNLVHSKTIPDHVPSAAPVTRPVVVLGATGKTGRRVADHLDQREIAVRRASRFGEHRFSWSDPSTWGGVLAGAGAVYVTFYPDLAAPGADRLLDELGRQVHRYRIDTAVLLSGRGEPAAAEAEQAFCAHVPNTTVVRCAWFDQNFTEGIFAGAVARNRISLPTSADTREPFVDAADVAEAVAVLLTSGPRNRRHFELTGPESISMATVAATLTEVTGRPIDYRAATLEDFAAGIAAEGDIDLEQAVGLAGALAEVFDGRSEHTTTDLAELLGRPARSFADFAHDARRAGLLDPAPEA